MLHAVLFLVAARQFVFLDAPLHVIVDVCRDNDAVLGAPVHRLRIDIVMLLFVLNEPLVVLEDLEICHCAVIDLRRVFVLSGGKIYFRLDDVVERFRVALGFGAGFFAVEHVVRAGGNFLHKLLRRTQAAEWFYFSHVLMMCFRVGWLVLGGSRPRRGRLVFINACARWSVRGQGRPKGFLPAPRVLSQGMTHSRGMPPEARPRL